MLSSHTELSGLFYAADWIIDAKFCSNRTYNFQYNIQLWDLIPDLYLCQ